MRKLLIFTSMLLLAAATASAGMINVALATNGGVATQSSTYLGGYDAANAIDGDLTNFSHTLLEALPWLEVQFSGGHPVNEFILYNRPNCPNCDDRANNFQVDLFMGSTNVGSWQYTNQGAWKILDQTFAEVQADRIRITDQTDWQGWGGSFLSLAEVEVFSTPEPMTLSLVGGAIVGLIFVKRRISK